MPPPHGHSCRGTGRRFPAPSRYTTTIRPNGERRWTDEQCFALAGLRSLERAVATADGQQAFDAAVTAMLDDARGGVSPRCASGAA
jgi:hypothetical protein